MTEAGGPFEVYIMALFANNFEEVEKSREVNITSHVPLFQK